jgi:hypothetical protein
LLTEDDIINSRSGCAQPHHVCVPRLLFDAERTEISVYGGDPSSVQERIAQVALLSRKSECDNVTAPRRTHPDRLANASPAETQRAKEKFQAVADAYFVLSDSRRRREYDNLHASRASAGRDSNATADFFSQFASMFGNSSGSAGAPRPDTTHADAEGVFADVFDEVGDT